MEQQSASWTHRDAALKAVQRLFAIAAAAVVVVFVLAVGLQLMRNRAERLVLHGREVGRLARVAVALSVDRQTAIRGYQLALDSAMLAPEFAARGRLPLVLDSLVALTADDSAQRRRARAFADAARRWERDHLVPVLALPLPELRERSRDLPLAGKPLFDAVRAASAEFLRQEDVLYDRRVAQLRRSEYAALLGTLLALVALAAVLVHVRRRILAQSQDLLLKQQQLEEQAIELEHQIEQSQELAVELEASNIDLVEAVARTEEAQHAVSAERQFLRAVLESLTDGIVACNADGVLTIFNSATREMLGKPEAAIPPHEWTDRYEVYREDGTTRFPVTELPLYRALQGETVRDVTVVLSPPDAPRRTTLISGRPVLGDGGEKLGAVVAIHDVTEKRALELQLQHAMRLEAVGQLAGGVAHDVNNVLAAIRGFADLLLQDLAPDSQQRGDVQQICEAVDRAAMLTRQLLAFSRRQILNPEVLELNALVPRSLKMISRLIGPGIQCNTSLAPDLGRVRADAGQLEQVLVNLAVNARDAMPDGGQLTIETMNVEIDAVRANRIGGPEGAAPGRYVMLAVNDTGIGMDRATQVRIFEPFFTTKEPGKGTGLGLSTVFGIVKQSGGQMSVYSEPGKGTTFRVFLPRVDAALAAACDTTPVEAVTAASATILVVDDDDAVRGAVRRMLTREGHTVLEAPSPREAEALWTRHEGEIDLLVTDLMMPHMNGGELAERFLTVRPAAAVLFTSGYTPDVVVRRGLVHAGAEFISKPFMLREFVDKVHELLRARGASCRTLPSSAASVLRR